MRFPPYTDVPPKVRIKRERRQLHWEDRAWPILVAVGSLARLAESLGAPIESAWVLLAAPPLAAVTLWRWRSRKRS